MKVEDDDLAARAQRGDRDASQQLLERHYDVVYRVAYRFLGDMEDAKDVTQDVCEALLVKKLRSYRAESKFSTWLYAVATNACYDHLRKRKSAEALLERYKTYIDIEGTKGPADGKELEWQSAWLEQALAKLEPVLRMTAILVLSEKQSHAEAARALGCAEGTVSWRMAEVRKRLRVLTESVDD